MSAFDDIKRKIEQNVEVSELEFAIYNCSSRMAFPETAKLAAEEYAALKARVSELEEKQRLFVEAIDDIANTFEECEPVAFKRTINAIREEKEKILSMKGKAE